MFKSNKHSTLENLLIYFYANNKDADQSASIQSNLCFCILLSYEIPSLYTQKPKCEDSRETASQRHLRA